MAIVYQQATEGGIDSDCFPSSFLAIWDGKKCSTTTFRTFDFLPIVDDGAVLPSLSSNRLIVCTVASRTVRRLHKTFSRTDKLDIVTNRSNTHSLSLTHTKLSFFASFYSVKLK